MEVARLGSGDGTILFCVSSEYFVLGCCDMILSKEEADSLTEVRHRSPHEFLGMHLLGNGSGVVARVLSPRAAEVEIVPTHEKNKPRFRLQQIGPGLFEGTSDKAKAI